MSAAGKRRGASGAASGASGGEEAYEFSQDKALLLASTWQWREDQSPRDYAPPLQEAFQFFPTKKGNRHWHVPGRVYWGKRRSVSSAASLSAPSPLPSPLPLRPHPLPAFFPLTLPRPLLQGVELGPAAPPPTVAERRAATSVFG